jgi:hypothetical protein
MFRLSLLRHRTKTVSGPFQNWPFSETNLSRSMEPFADAH